MLQFNSLGPVGAEVMGFDPAVDLPEPEFRQLFSALLDHGLLLIRGLAFTDEQYVRLGRRFGTIQNHRISRFSPPGYPEIHILSNGVENGQPIGNVDAGQFWHSDGTYLPEPYMFTMLRAVRVPRAEDGKPLGDTLFANTAGAYDALPAEVQARIENLRAVHSYAYRYRLRVEKNAKAQSGGAELRPDVLHPVVRPHPITGRKVLFLNEGYVCGIEGVAPAESDALLARLLPHGLKNDFRYSHVWQEDDVLIWDNNSTMHCAVQNYTLPQVRTMKRINVRSTTVRP